MIAFDCCCDCVEMIAPFSSSSSYRHHHCGCCNSSMKTDCPPSNCDCCQMKMKMNTTTTTTTSNFYCCANYHCCCCCYCYFFLVSFWKRKIFVPISWFLSRPSWYLVSPRELASVRIFPAAFVPFLFPLTVLVFCALVVPDQTPDPPRALPYEWKRHCEHVRFRVPSWQLPFVYF